jgi:hypothetical protein
MFVDPRAPSDERVQKPNARSLFGSKYPKPLARHRPLVLEEGDKGLKQHGLT